jgi:hypothetical protein
MRREFAIIGEELAAGVRRRAPDDALQGGHPVDDALALLEECVRAAERASVAAARESRARGE